MASKPKNETTSPRVASIAAKALANPKTPATVKTLAGSVLTQKVRTPAKKTS